MLLGKMEWQREAENDSRFLMRGHDVKAAAEMVLLKVAAHAADAEATLLAGGFTLTPPERPPRMWKRMLRRRRDPRARVTRQLRFTTMCN
jgi:hypothetical protein